MGPVWQRQQASGGRMGVLGQLVGRARVLGRWEKKGGWQAGWAGWLAWAEQAEPARPSSSFFFFFFFLFLCLISFLCLNSNLV